MAPRGAVGRRTAWHSFESSAGKWLLSRAGSAIIGWVENAWVRPYAPGAGRWWVLGWELFSLAALGWTTVRNFQLDGHAVNVTVLVLVAGWLLGSWRIIRMGVYLGDGVQIRGLLRTRTLRWDDIAHVWLHTASHKIGPWEIANGMTVLIERRDGSMVNTELWARGVDFHSRPSVFRAVYRELRDRHLAATARGPFPAPA
jgi:hypothetical protein